MPRKRAMLLSPEGKYVSNLEPYIATKSKDFPEWLIVRCPREDCPGHELGFLVHGKTWYKSREQIGRSCPYCFRVSRLPKRGAVQQGR